MRKSYPLLILLSVMALVVLPRTAEAQNYNPLYLQHVSFYTDAPGYEENLNYYLGGYENYGNYTFYGDFFTGPVALTDASLSVTYYGDDGTVVPFSQHTGPASGAEGIPVTLRLTFYSNYHIPPNTGGVFNVAFKIYFADGTYLEDHRFVQL